MRLASLVIFALISVAGCSSSNDDSTVKSIPENSPVTPEQKETAAAAVQNDPKASVDAPRPDGG